MTFNQALNLKKEKYSDVITKEDGSQWYVRVMPKNEDEFKNYYLDFQKKDLTDEDAKSYCTNDEYFLYEVKKETIDYKRLT